MTSRTPYILSEISQWLSAGIVLAGIAIEVSYRAHAGIILITTGTFAWAIVQKLKPHLSRHPRQ